MRYNIDIGENIVRVIRFNKKGIIKGYGSCDVPDLTGMELGGKEYVDVLGGAIKKAGRNAGLPAGFGTPCEVVVGGPQMVVRRFIWPDLPLEAQIENAEIEITPFLPDSVKNFVIGYEVLRKINNAEFGSVNLEVIVAAVPKNFANAIVKAARKGTFKVTRIDVRENARAKVVAQCNRLEIPPSSYALLDFTQPQANVSLYLNGVFYSNRYFAPSLEEVPITEPVDPAETEDADELLQNLRKRAMSKSVALNYNTDALANEVVSIIDYMHYRERGSAITSVLLLGEENLSGIETSLKENLEIAIFNTSEWVKSSITEKPANLIHSIDAYGTGLIGLDPKERINLKPTLIKNKATHKRRLVSFFIFLGFLLALLAIGIAIPTIQRNTLWDYLNQLDVQLAQYPITVEDISQLHTRIASMDGQSSTIEQFFEEIPQIRNVIPLVFRDDIDVSALRASGFNITVEGYTVNFNSLVDIIEELRDNELIESVQITAATDSETAQLFSMSTSFSMQIRLNEGTGTR